MLMLTRARTSAVVFDTGAAGLRAVQVEQRRGALRLIDRLCVEAPATQDLDPARLGRLLEQGDFQGDDVALCLSSRQFSFHVLRIPEKALEQPTEQVEELVALETARETRTDPAEWETRWWRLATRGGPNVAVIAVKRAFLLQWDERFQAMGLTLRRVEVAPWGLVRLAARQTVPDPQDAWGVLDLGHTHTTLTVVVGQTPSYVRALRLSGAALSQRLAQAYQLDPVEAQELKHAHGIQAGDGGAVADPQSALQNAAQLPLMNFNLLRESLDALVRETAACFSFALQGDGELQVRRLVLAGGGARLSGLRDWLELQLGLPIVELATDGAPWELPVHGAVQPEEASAVGAALLDLESE